MFCADIFFLRNGVGGIVTGRFGHGESGGWKAREYRTGECRMGCMSTAGRAA